MARAKNAVIAGDHNGRPFTVNIKGEAVLVAGLTKHIPINKQYVASYELVTDEHVKSASSGVARGLVGGALLGPVGMLAGAFSAKNKGIYQIAIAFHDGTRSLVEADDKLYKIIVKSIF